MPHKKKKHRKHKTSIPGPFNLQTELRGNAKDIPSKLLGIKFERDLAERETIQDIPTICKGSKLMTRHLSLDWATNRLLTQD